MDGVDDQAQAAPVLLPGIPRVPHGCPGLDAECPLDGVFAGDLALRLARAGCAWFPADRPQRAVRAGEHVTAQVELDAGGQAVHVTLPHRGTRRFRRGAEHGIRPREVKVGVADDLDLRRQPQRFQRAPGLGRGRVVVEDGDDPVGDTRGGECLDRGGQGAGAALRLALVVEEADQVGQVRAEDFSPADRNSASVLPSVSTMTGA